MTPRLSLRGTLAALARHWHAFFHTPCDARICALVRIAFAAILLVHLSVVYRDTEMLYSDAGVLPLAAARQIASVHAESIFWRLPSTPEVMHTCVLVMAAHALLLLVGLLPNLNAAALFLWIASLQYRNVVVNDGEDTAMRMLCFFLIWMPIGRVWSIDAAARRCFAHRSGRGSLSNEPAAEQASGVPARYAAPGWPLRLWQLQMAVIFLSTALLKLQGQTWLGGTALYYVSRLDDFFGRFWVPAAAFDSPWCVALLTWSVLLAELAIPLLIWFRETRLACLAVLLVFHLASDWSMHLFLFHWVMLAGWLAFLTPGDLDRVWPVRRNTIA